jgi:hypothetical protein
MPTQVFRCDGEDTRVADRLEEEEGEEAEHKSGVEKA